MVIRKRSKKFPNWKRYSRVVVLIDNANIIHALSTLGWKLDHRKLKDYFERRGFIHRFRKIPKALGAY